MTTMARCSGSEVREHRFELDREQLGISSFTLPYRDDLETELAELVGALAISFSIALELGQPELLVALGRGRESTAWMPVPEAAVDEHHPLASPVGEVGASW